MSVSEKDSLVLEIIALAYAVDRNTDYAVFIDYSGHVEHLRVDIAESKERYSNKLASTKFYIDGKYERSDDLGWLKAKRDHLRSIVESGRIDTEGMEEVVQHVVTHSF